MLAESAPLLEPVEPGQLNGQGEFAGVNPVVVTAEPEAPAAPEVPAPEVRQIPVREFSLPPLPRAEALPVQLKDGLNYDGTTPDGLHRLTSNEGRDTRLATTQELEQYKLVPVPDPESAPAASTPQESLIVEEQEEPSDEEPPTLLSPENKSFFSKMSEKSRNLAKRAYNGLLHSPGVEKVMARFQIAYNQFWLDRSQRRAVELKDRIDQLQTRADALDMSKNELQSVIDSLSEQNLPGTEAIQLKIQDIDRRKSKLLTEKDTAQSGFEAADNQAKLYVEQRDVIADKLIKTYDEQLKPMEAELEALQTFRDETDLVMEVTFAKHQEQQVKLDEIEEKKIKIEAALRQSGMSEKDIRQFSGVKELDALLDQAWQQIDEEEEGLSAERLEINAEIAAADAKANPVRDRREEFIRLKQDRPLEINVAARQRQEDAGFVVDANAHPRDAAESASSPILAESAGAGRPETITDQRPGAGQYLNQWNSLLAEKYGDDAQGINADEFLTGTGLSEGFQLDPDRFKSILGAYIKAKKLPRDQFNQSQSEFLS